MLICVGEMSTLTVAVDPPPLTVSTQACWPEFKPGFGPAVAVTVSTSAADGPLSVTAAPLRHDDVTVAVVAPEIVNVCDVPVFVNCSRVGETLTVVPPPPELGA